MGRFSGMEISSSPGLKNPQKLAQGRKILSSQGPFEDFSSCGMKKFSYLKITAHLEIVFLYELLLAMAIEKFPYIFKNFMKPSVALMKRYQIYTWVMWKSDFHMTHEEIVFKLLLFDKFFGHVEI